MIPAAEDSGQPFRIVVDGTTSDDQIFIDPTLGVNVTVHGGPGRQVRAVHRQWAYNVQYTPCRRARRSLNSTSMPHALFPKG